MKPNQNSQKFLRKALWPRESIGLKLVANLEKTKMKMMIGCQKQEEFKKDGTMIYSPIKKPKVL